MEMLSDATLKILLVDDQNSHRMVLAAELQARGRHASVHELG